MNINFLSSRAPLRSFCGTPRESIVARRAAVLAFVLGATLGGAATFFALGRTAVEAVARDGATAAREKKLFTSARAVAMPLTAAKTIERFRAIAAMPEAQEKADALAALARQADEEDVPDLLAVSLSDPFLGSDGRDLARTLVTRWASHDPARALVWVRANGGAARTTLLQVVAMEWSSRDPRSAIAAAQIGGAADRAEMLRAVLMQWGKADPDAANAWLESQPVSPLMRDLQFHFWQALVARDPVAAADFAAAPVAFRSGALAQIISTWAEREPLGALAWALDQPVGETRAVALNELAGPWAAVDPQAATNYGLGLTEPNARRVFLGSLGAALAALDPTKAVAWARNLPPGEEKVAAFSGALARWAEYDPVGAVNCWNASFQSDPAVMAASLQPIAFQWAIRDPQAAAKWIASLPPSAARLDAAAVVVGQWIDVDPSQFTGWCRQLPESGVRDEFFAVAAERLSVTAPAHAIICAENIGDTSRRNQILDAAFTRWRHSDPVAAASWLGSAALDSALKQRLSRGNAAVD